MIRKIITAGIICVLGGFEQEGTSAQSLKNEQVMEEKILFQQVLTTPQKLFSLKYGAGQDEIGLHIPEEPPDEYGCIVDIAVGIDGCIYIADFENGRIKKFDKTGRLLFLTEGRKKINQIVVNSKGKIYGVSNNKVVIYDKTGKELLDEERKVEELLLREIKKNINTKDIDKIKAGGNEAGRFWIQRIVCDLEDNIFITVINTDNNTEFLFKLDDELKFVKMFQRKMITEGMVYPYKCRYLYQFRYIPVESQKGEYRVHLVDGSINRFFLYALEHIEITIYNEENEICKTLTYPIKRFNDIEKNFLPFISDDVIADVRGHFFVERTMKDLYHKRLGPGKIGFDCYKIGPYGIVEYDENLNFIGLRIIVYNFGGSNPWKVDPQGNIYYLDFKSDHVDVMMAPAPKKGAKRNK
ncbi:MAG: hypothetical protein NC906_06200 [Candidatus Omnitrophica bacterium]|nr:hypothetical protein [Candidatus Omnitrophota bacterium]